LRSRRSRRRSTIHEAVCSGRVAERDQQLVDHGRYGYHLLNTLTVTGTDFVTVIDTLSKDAD